jgi:hypothetical protein
MIADLFIRNFEGDSLFPIPGLVDRRADISATQSKFGPMLQFQAAAGSVIRFVKLIIDAAPYPTVSEA